MSKGGREGGSGKDECMREGIGEHIPIYLRLSGVS